MPSWYLHTVAVGEHLVASGSADRPDDALPGVRYAPAGSTTQGDLFAWSGLHITLYRDACERYWHALIGEKPLIYVVCRETMGDNSDIDKPVRPGIVSLDYDEAVAASETDTLVLSGPIPAELYRYMEAFVLQHYRPRQLKKRKRQDWHD